jgi:hypothetical protein
METATEAHQHNRELTTTEIKIAIAQIEDRLMRVVKAQDEYGKFSDTDEELSNEDYKEKEFALRKKYDLPNKVHIFGGEWDEDKCYSKYVNICKKHISAFVKGQLTEETFADLYFFFEEVVECDYGFILIDKPSGFYGAGGEGCDNDEIVKELKVIGCRSKIKNKNLPVLYPILFGVNKETIKMISSFCGHSKEVMK